MKQACFEEGSQSADMKYPLFGLSRRCIPSWVISALRAALWRLRSETRLRAQSRAHPSLPSRSIYHFIDSIKRDRFKTVPLLYVDRSDVWRQHEIHGVDTGGSAAVNAAKYAVISNNKCYGKLLYTDWNQKRYSVMTFWERACMEKPLLRQCPGGNCPDTVRCGGLDP